MLRSTQETCGIILMGNKGSSNVDLSKTSLTRRQALAGAGTASLVSGLSFLCTGAALARAPMIGIQAPYFYRFRIGDAEATIVSDGLLPLGDPHKAFKGLSSAEMNKQLKDNFLPLNDTVFEQNILILNTGDKLVLFDTGMGYSQMFGPTAGKLLATMKQAGINPGDIDVIVMSHAHVDHCAGCMTAAGERNFPNAEYWISQADFDFWTDEKKLDGPMKDAVKLARDNLLPNRDRLNFFKDGQEFLPGVQAMSAPGHTVGHTIFMIQNGGSQLCYVGDLAHHPVLLLENPYTEFAYDTDPGQSAKTRVKMLTMLAANRTPILAYHFPWPGIGHVAKEGQGFRFFPEVLDMAKVDKI